MMTYIEEVLIHCMIISVVSNSKGKGKSMIESNSERTFPVYIQHGTPVVTVSRIKPLEINSIPRTKVNAIKIFDCTKVADRLRMAS